MTQSLLGAGPWTTLRAQTAAARFNLAHWGTYTDSSGATFAGRIIAQFDTELALEDLDNSPNSLDMRVETLDSDFPSERRPAKGWRFTFPSGLIIELIDVVRRHDISADWTVRFVNPKGYL